MSFFFTSRLHITGLPQGAVVEPKIFVQKLRLRYFIEIYDCDFQSYEYHSRDHILIFFYFALSHKHVSWVKRLRYRIFTINDKSLTYFIAQTIKHKNTDIQKHYYSSHLTIIDLKYSLKTKAHTSNKFVLNETSLHHRTMVQKKKY